VSSGLLFPLDAAIAELNAKKDKLQASFTAWDQRRERQSLVSGLGSAADSSTGTGSSSSGGVGLAWAKQMVGHFKESTGSNTGPELDQLQREFGTHAAAWCAEFATKALVKAGAPKELLSASVAQLRGWAQAGTHGLQKGVKSTGRVGDLMAFGNDHIGVVEKIVNGVVHTIEGNTSSGKVARRTHAMGSGDFFRPVMSSTAAGGTVRTPTGFTPTSFAESLLRALGIKATAGSLKGVIGWEHAEGGNWNNAAKHNPLNTTLRAAGAKSINSVGVKSYKSWEQGLAATVKTLKNGKYAKILAALRSGDPMAIADAIGSSPWGTSGGLVKGSIASAKVGKRGGSLVIGGDGGSISDAMKQLQDFDRQAKRSKQLAAIDVKIQGLERVKAFKGAIDDLRASVANGLNQAVDSFRTNWENTTGKAIDAANAAMLKGFDQTTDAIIAQTAAAQELARLRGIDDSVAKAKEDADNAKALADAQFLVAHSGGQVHADALVQLADAQAQIEATQRKRQEDQLEAQVAAETAAIQDQRAQERQALEDRMAAARAAQLDADVANFQAAEQAKLNALTASLEAQRLTYKDYVRKVNALLAGIGGGSLDPSADQEAVINGGSGGGSSYNGYGAFRRPRKHAAGGWTGLVLNELGPERLYANRSGGVMVQQASEVARGGGGGGVVVNYNGPVTIGSQKAARVKANQLAHRLRFG
jgi:hypothetical protein